MKPVYFFHIPKTSGRFFYSNVIFLAESVLLRNNIQYGDILKGIGHRSFAAVDSVEMLGITILRDPISRSVSHWFHIYNNISTGNPQEDKINFIDFLHQNPNKGIIDYQTKFISYNGGEPIINIEENTLTEQVTEADLNLAKTRLSKLDYVFNMDYLDNLKTNTMLSIILNNFNLEPYFDVNSLDLNVTFTFNPRSAALYDSLSNSEKLEISDIMKNDMELFNSTKFTAI